MPDTCTLCSLPTPADPVTDPEVDGTFCCPGCLAVARGLEAVPDVETPEVDESEEALPAGERAYFGVEGMHCSTCEAFLERRAESVAGVARATASYANDAMCIEYDPDRVDEPAIAAALDGLGYALTAPGEGSGPADDQALVRFLLGGGLFGMMVMVWYGLFLYPSYLGGQPLVDLGGYDGRYLFAQLWLLTSVVVGYTGYPILRGAYVSLRAGRPNMDLLVTTAVLAAYAYSTVAVLVGRTDLYFDVSVAIVLVVTAGTWYERRIKRSSLSLLSSLTAQQVDTARTPDGETVALETVAPGDRLLVHPGERVPLDGTVTEGKAAVDESLLTGESLPVDVEPGDRVRGGTLVTDGPLLVTVGDRAASSLDALLETVWDIQSTRPGVQRLADRLATLFVPLVLVLAVLATLLTAWVSGVTTGVLVGLTVLIVSCPCALGLATPLAVASGVQSAARRQVVLTSESVFEDVPDVQTVVFDKTGTLTTGEMAVRSVTTVDGVSDEAVLERAAALERYVSHPVAQAIAGAAIGSVDVSLATLERHDRGVSAVLEGEEVAVGHPAWVSASGYEQPDDLAVQTAGTVPVAVAWGGLVRGVITVGDEPREGWAETLERLADDHEIVVLTGDDGPAAARYREHPAVDAVYDGVPPAGKAATVERLRAHGPVAMVGDGSNDAPALSAADVGIAMGSGTDLASDAADAVVASDDIRAVPEVFFLTRATNRRIRENLGWAFVYNGIAIPLALAGLLNPLLAAVAMATSSALVVTNSARSMGRG